MTASSLSKSRQKDLYDYDGYHPGHPWYYVRGGTCPGPKTIMKNVIATGYRGSCRDSIDATNRLAEPVRTRRLKKLRLQYQQGLENDLVRYRQYVRQINRLRRTGQVDHDPVSCDDIHMSLSLKHNHIYNDLAHLRAIDAIFAEQLDLFASL